jgi:hypothetical protein
LGEYDCVNNDAGIKVIHRETTLVGDDGGFSFAARLTDAGCVDSSLHTDGTLTWTASSHDDRTCHPADDELGTRSDSMMCVHAARICWLVEGVDWHSTV